MQFLTAKCFQNKALTFNFILGTLFTCTLFSPISIASITQLQAYNAEYDIIRKGERHGVAYRKFSKQDNTCNLSYTSDIKWMIFSDKRREKAKFTCQDTSVTPQSYAMERKGTGPDRKYTLKFDHEAKKVSSNRSKYPLDVELTPDVQDLISYQVKMRLDLMAGKKEFDYPIIDKKGKSRNYKFEIVGEEMITLPFGNVKTVKAKRLYNNDKRQAFAWFAPEMDYLLVRMWKGEKGVEQFDVQLKKYTIVE